MNKSHLLKTVLIATIPVAIFGCTKKEADKPSKPDEGKEKTVTSEKLTNFTGLAEKIKNEKIPDNEIICTVGDDAINVGDYKLQFRFKQDQAKEQLKAHPREQNRLLAEAMRLGVKLSDKEKKEFVEAAIKKGGDELQKQFASGKIDKDKFAKSVLNMGVVLKAVNASIEKRLLTEMINNSLLLNAARKAGLGKIAYNKYVEIKHTKKFKEYMYSSTLTPNQVKDLVMEEILIDLVKQKITKRANIRDKELFDFYKSNKKNFKHGERVKWSQIVISDPDADFKALTSIATKINREFPKLSKEKKIAKLKELKEKKKQLALKVVQKAKNGQDFKALANEYTEDIAARASKNGGNMEYADLSEMAQNSSFKNVANALETMQENEVYPKPVKTVFGWHIIKLDEKQGAGTFEFDEVKDSIRRILMNQNADLVLRSWIIKQRETVPVKISKKFEPFFSQINDLGGAKSSPSKKTESKTPEKPTEKAKPDTNK